VIDAQDEQFVEMALVVDPKGRHAPTGHDSAGAKTRHWTFELAICQAFDAVSDLCAQLRSGSGFALFEIANCHDEERPIVHMDPVTG